MCDRKVYDTRGKKEEKKLTVRFPWQKFYRQNETQADKMKNIYIYSSSSFTGFYNPLAGFSLLILEVSRSHTMTRHSR